MAYSISQVYALVNCVLYSVEQYHIRSWKQWFRSLECSQLLTGTIHIKYSLMINVIGCWNMHTMIVNMFILTVWEGTSLAILLIPVCRQMYHRQNGVWCGGSALLINSLGRNILGHFAHSSVSKCTISKMAFGVVGRPCWRLGLRQSHSLFIAEAMPTVVCSGLTGEG